MLPPRRLTPNPAKVTERNHLDQHGAEMLARRIERWWYEHHGVTTVKCTTYMTGFAGCYDVRSNLVRGWPPSIELPDLATLLRDDTP